MNCAECKEHLVAYIEGLLAESQKQAIELHLKSCPPCRAEAAAITTLYNRMTTNGKVLAQTDLEDKVLSRIVREQNLRLRKADNHFQLWRKIMNSKITKLATAAAIIVIAVLSITFLDKSVTPAYAIEQTIEAMRSINSIHAYCTDWDNSQGEVWVQIDPNTGQEEYYYADQGNLLIVATPQATYYYYKDKNLVRIRNEYVPASEVRFSRFFEDLVRWVQQYNGQLRFYFQFDEELQQEVIMVYGSIPTQGDMKEKEFIFRVDSQTKLPISLEMLK